MLENLKFAAVAGAGATKVGKAGAEADRDETAEIERSAITIRVTALIVGCVVRSFGGVPCAAYHLPDITLNKLLQCRVRAHNRIN